MTGSPLGERAGSGKPTQGRCAARVVAVCCLALACAAPPRWRADDQPSDRDTALLFTEQGAAGTFREMHASEIPRIPVRANLRPCCAFGAQLRAKIGPVPIPGYCIGNMLGPGDLGGHVYDSGVVQVGSRVDEEGLVHSESNGLVYTCRGGFIDTAHVRDYADWAIFLATSIARNLETGLDLSLPDEGGQRRVIVQPFDPATVERVGRRAIAIELGQWLAFQLSVWHEIATWYGWSTLGAFPEKVSAFSPEDLYSNLIGARIAAAIASQRTARDESLYNRSVDEWLDRVLDHLGAVPADIGREAMTSVDGLWWDSARRLPDPALVLRRNVGAGAVVSPWLVPAGRMGPELRQSCGSHPVALPIANPDSIEGESFADRASLMIQVSSELAGREPFRSLGGRVTDRDFAAILETIREQNRAEFGSSANRPE